MRTLSTTPPFTCVTCEAPAPGQPVFHLGLPFCCAGCAADGPCTCSYDEEVPDAPDTDARPAHDDRVRVAVAFDGVPDDPRRLVGASR